MNPYIPVTDEDLKVLLEKSGVKEVKELFSDIPFKLQLNRDLDLPEGKSELEVRKIIEELAEENFTTDDLVCFLGAGAYDRYIPSIVKHLAGRSEFYTAYTPYQPEISQGTLQVIFEYQTMICELTGMDVANASVYDGANATAEAAIMSAVSTRRNKILCSEGVNPQIKSVLNTYLRFRGFDIEYIPLENGETDHKVLEEKLDKTVASVIVQNPNFFGVIENVEPIVEKIHINKSLLIISADPISLGILKKPSEYGADIVVGEGQQLGGSLAFGGPYLGFISCTEKLMRKMPGRIVGQSVDVDGKRAFVLTLQAREQHIRRYKATSNICSNQAHNALIACIYLITMGREGLREVALQTIQKTNYLFNEMQKIKGYQPLFKDKKYFSEFPIVSSKDVDYINYELANQGFIGGFNLESDFPQYKKASLYCVTEKRTKEEMDVLITVLGGLE